MVAFFDGLARESTRKAKPPAKKRKRGRTNIAMETEAPPVSRTKVLKDTSDLVQYYQAEVITLQGICSESEIPNSDRQ